MEHVTPSFDSRFW